MKGAVIHSCLKFGYNTVPETGNAKLYSSLQKFTKDLRNL